MECEICGKVKDDYKIRLMGEVGESGLGGWIYGACEECYQEKKKEEQNDG